MADDSAENTYTLSLDGPLLRTQRQLLLDIETDFLKDGCQYSASLVRGLTHLLDAIADQAHDRHSIDCLLIDNDLQE